MHNELLNVLLMNLKSSFMSLLIIVAAFFAPIGPLLVLVGLAIASDTLFGIIKAYKKKEKITSRKLSAIVSKMALYEFAVIGVYVIDKFLMGDIIAMFTAIPLVLTKLVVATLLSIEIKSVNENIEIAYGINLWDSFKHLLRRAKDIKDDLGDLTDNNNEGNIEGE